MRVLHVLRRLGGYATASQLGEHGIGPGLLRIAVRSGEIWRPRKGHYLDPAHGPDVARAVRVGGALTCVSAAHRLGLWTPADPRLHVAVSPNASRFRTPQSSRHRLVDEPDLVLHWSRSRPAPVEDIVDVLVCVAVCCARRDFFVCLESALHHCALSSARLSELRSRVPARLRRLVDRASGLSGSGGESMFKLALIDAGIPFRQQVVIPGVGRVDFLIGDAPIVEIDSRAHHSDPAADRHRDARARLSGRRTLRFMYRTVDTEIPTVLDVVRRARRDGDHILRAADRCSGDDRA